MFIILVNRLNRFFLMKKALFDPLTPALSRREREFHSVAAT
jgi:hypothetical protein